MIAKRKKLRIDINEFNVIDTLLFKILFDMQSENNNNITRVNGVYWLLGRNAIEEFFLILDSYSTESNKQEIENLRNVEL